MSEDIFVPGEQLDRALESLKPPAPKDERTPEQTESELTITDLNNVMKCMKATIESLMAADKRTEVEPLIKATLGINAQVESQEVQLVQ